MTTIALDRQGYQHEVESLLEQIRRGVAELRRLQVAGVRGPGLAERKRELARTRARLAAVVGRREGRPAAATARAA